MTCRAAGCAEQLALAPVEQEIIFLCQTFAHIYLLSLACGYICNCVTLNQNSLEVINLLAADRKRAFGRWLMVSVLIFFVFQVADICFDLQEPGQNALIMHIFSGTITPVMSVSPVLAAVPFATGFARDWRSGMAVSMLVRSGKRRFYSSKILCCVLGGGLALMLGTLLYVLFLNLWFSHNYGEYAEMIQHVAFYDFSTGVNLRNIIGYYAAVCFLQFMAGAFWSMVAMTVSAFLPNISLTLCAPLVFFKLAEEINMYFPPFLSPYLLQTGNVGLSVPSTLGAATFVFGCGILLLSLLFYWRGSRRLSRT